MGWLIVIFRSKTATVKLVNVLKIQCPCTTFVEKTTRVVIPEYTLFLLILWRHNYPKEKEQSNIPISCVLNITISVTNNTTMNRLSNRESYKSCLPYIEFNRRL